MNCWTSRPAGLGKSFMGSRFDHTHTHSHTDLPAFRRQKWSVKHFTSYPSLPTDCPLEDCLQFRSIARGHISQIYSTLQHIKADSVSKARNAWELDLNLQIPDDLRDLSVSKIHESSICIRHCIIRFKILHRAYLTKAKLAKIYNTSDDRCLRCKQSPADISHMFWTCSDLNRFWELVFKALSYMFGKTIDPNPMTAVFGVLPNHHGITSYQMNAVAFSSLLARWLILLKWKDSGPPVFIQWVREVMRCLQIEHLRYSLRGSQSKYYKTWSSFVEYVEKLSFTEV